MTAQLDTRTSAVPPGGGPPPAGSERTPGDPVLDAVKVAKALADPTRLRMLELMSAGRSSCCSPSPAPAPPPDEDADGICVCEFQAMFGLGQSRTSYHLRVLRDARLVRETSRGKWSFYGVDQERLRASLDSLAGAAGLKDGCG